MRHERPLYERLYQSPLLIELARRIGYLGFPYRELANRCRDLAATYSPERLCIALKDIATVANNRVMLNEAARKAAWQLLGPPPEKWPEIYEHVAHRPANWDNPPEIPPGGPDPLMEMQLSYGATTLLDRLKLVRRSLAGNNTAFLESQYRQELQCIEAEMVRRGIDIPPEPTGEPKAPKKLADPKLKKQAKRKKAG